MEKKKKRLQGKVVSTKMAKTIVVLVENYVTHPKYKKRIRKTKKFLVHDEHDDAKLGDIVEIIACRLISKRKAFRLLQVLEEGKGVEDDSVTK